MSKLSGSGPFIIYLVLFNCVVVIAILALVKIPFSTAVFMVIMVGVLSYFSIKAITETFVLHKLRNINVRIDSFIKNKKPRTEKQGLADELSRLEYIVSRLIKEKTTEIDNLKEMEKYRKEFLGDVAHELRSPIFNIQGYIHTLLEGGLEDPEINQRFLQKAAKNIDHLSTLVEDLVMISKLEAGGITLEWSEFNIADLVKEVNEFLDLSAKQKNITLTLKTNADNKNLIVRADKQKIRQVLINLIGNSIKYGRENGHTVIALEDMQQFVTVEISDNGEGISEEHLPRIFERFYRVDKSRSRAQSGTGLGLSIVKHFIEAHKQKILATSREGIGSIFSFNLEKAKAPIRIALREEKL